MIFVVEAEENKYPVNLALFNVSKLIEVRAQSINLLSQGHTK